MATAETDPVPHDGDAADDPAIWVHPADPARSVVIGTDKQEGGGLFLYDLRGRQIGAQTDGPMNNADVRGDLVVAGNEANNTIAVYRMDPSGTRLVPAASGAIRPELTIYGTCLYRSPASGRIYAIVTSDKGQVEQWELVDAGGGLLGGRQVRTFSLGSQTEGCVADDHHQALYIGEEAVGIWRFGAEPTAGDDGVLIDTTRNGGHLRADVEGLTIAAYADGSGFLIASSQGNNEYAVYDRTSGAFLATFRIEDGSVDGTSDTDGIDVTTIPMGSAYPAGLFVAQDGKNAGGKQNFKLVSLADVLR